MNDEPRLLEALPLSPALSARADETADELKTRRVGQVAYQMVAEDLRTAIADGQFTQGRRLPTEVELSARYNISRQTVRRALQELVSEGLVFRVRGRGTYPTSVSTGRQYLRSVGSIEDLHALSIDTELEAISPLTRKVDVDAAAHLRVAADDVMVAVTRRLHEGVPFCVTRIVVPFSIGQRLIERGMLAKPGRIGNDTVIRTLDEISAHPLVGAQQTITCGLASSDIAPLLDLEPGAPMLRIDRVYFDAVGQPLELAVNYFNPDRYSYRLELRRSVPAQRRAD